jgi:hypothetical protein
MMDASQLRALATARIADRTRTVWDARRILHPVIGQVVSIVRDDGQHAAVRRAGVLQDVIHTPSLGFALKIKGLLPADEAGRRLPAARADQRRLTLVPVSSLRAPVDQRVVFLLRPASEWQLPEPWVSCPACGAMEAGRYCTQCGHLVRPNGAHPGEGFSAEQEVLRERGSPEHGCGAMWARHHLHCAKCGEAVG